MMKMMADPFDDVGFVHHMSNHELKVHILKMWRLLQQLAKTMEDSRPDIVSVIDTILSNPDANSVSMLSMLRDRRQFVLMENILIKYDSLENTISTYDVLGKYASNIFDAKSFDVINKDVEKYRKRYE